MTHRLPGLLLLCAGAAFCQSQTPAFEAASIKPSKTSDVGSGWHTRPGYLVTNNQTLKSLIGIAYSIPADRVLGGPKWIESDHFDVEARASSPAGEPELSRMLQSTLAERFQLTVHRDTKTLPAFAMVLGKNGLRIHPDESEGGSRSNGSRGKLVAQRMSMAKLAEKLTRLLGEPVVDDTNAQGVFTFTLEWAPETKDSAAADGPSLFTALQQELGVKLESKKLPVEVIVIDKAEKPTEN
jgi:uncharacterized protein (TIGR03435 family)